MSNETYNGWTNYETWNYKLWIDNEEASYLYWLEQAADILKESESTDYMTKQENAICTLGDQLKDECDQYLEEYMPDQASCFADLLNGAVSAINWHEIASSLIDSAIEEQNYEESA